MEKTIEKPSPKIIEGLSSHRLLAGLTLIFTIDELVEFSKKLRKDLFSPLKLADEYDLYNRFRIWRGLTRKGMLTFYAYLDILDSEEGGQGSHHLFEAQAKRPNLGKRATVHTKLVAEFIH